MPARRAGGQPLFRAAGEKMLVAGLYMKQNRLSMFACAQAVYLKIHAIAGHVPRFQAEHLHFVLNAARRLHREVRKDGMVGVRVADPEPFGPGTQSTPVDLIYVAGAPVVHWRHDWFGWFGHA